MSEENKNYPQNWTREETETERSERDIIDVTPTKEVQVERPKKNKFSGMLTGLVAGTLLTACVAFGGYSLFFLDHGYQTESAASVIEEQTNPKLKATELDRTVVYKISGAEDTMNGLTMTVDGVQFRRDSTRIWVHVKNDGQRKVMAMLTSSSSLVDNNGHQYAIDPFAVSAINEIPVGMDERVMLVFEPVREGAESLTYHIDSLSDMKNPAWNVDITFDIPS